MERDKKRQTDRHMTRDLECQEFQKRGERKRERERERERKKERDILQMCTHLYLYFFTVTRSSLLALSSHVGLSLSLSLSLLCVCTNVDVYSYVVLYSSLPPLFLSHSHRHTLTQWNRAKLSMSCNYQTVARKKTQKEPHRNTRMRVRAHTHKPACTQRDIN